MSEGPFNVLFLCTGNSARSIMAESILRKEGAGKFIAYSAGSKPKGAVHPMALNVLQFFGYPTAGLRSKSWDEFAIPGAPQMDFIFTVCDKAAGEVCPIWPGKPVTTHWGVADPAAEGSGLQGEAAFAIAARYLKLRIDAFISVPITSLGKSALNAQLNTIGQMEGATSKPAAAR